MKQVIKTDNAPAPLGVYSQAFVVDCNKLVFLCGQIPVDPATNEVVQGDIKVQTKQALRNMRELLKASGSGMEHLVKVTVFLKDFNEFSQFNEVYKEYFTEDPPPRTAVEVSGLPKGVGLEIEGIAIVP